VKAELDPTASVSVNTQGGLGGNVAIGAPGGKTVAMLGVNTGGHGTLIVHDPEGNPRAFVQGTGAVFIHNQSGKQLAGMITVNNKGRLGVWGAGGSGERVVSLDEGENGSGSITTYDSTHKKLVALDEFENGGRVGVWPKGKNDVGAHLYISRHGGGEMVLMEPTGGIGIMATALAQDGGRGVSVYGPPGEAVAKVTAHQDGTGLIQVGTGDGPAVILSQDSNKNGNVFTYNSAGDASASMGTSQSGKGQIAVLEKDHVAAELTANDAGSGQMLLRDTKGEISLDAFGGGSEALGGSVVAFNKSGEPVASLGSTAEGKGEFTVSEKNHNVARFTANETGAGQIYLSTPTGEIRLSATAQGSPSAPGGSLAVHNSSDERIASIGTSDDGKGSIRILEKDKPLVELTATTQGGAVKATNNQGTMIAGLGANEEGKGRVAVYGEKGGLATLSENSGAGVVWVKNAQDKIVAGISGDSSSGGVMLVTNSAGETTTEMSTFGDGRGRVVVWNPGGQTDAVTMTRSPDGPGGLVQVSNATIGVAHLRVNGRGDGHLQLDSATGVTSVTAGTTPEGIGMAAVGPNITCMPGGGLGLTLSNCLMGRQ
jgi:hypothetical protein